MKMKFCTVNFNTQKLTDALILSILKHHKEAEIYVFDNSDKTPFINTFNSVKVFDNTKQQIINFNEILVGHNADVTKNTGNNYGSFKHCITIEKCIELIGDNFILLDSDVLLKRPLNEIWDDKYIAIGDVWPQGNKWCNRIVPFVLYINVDMCKKMDIHFYYEKLMFGLNYGKDGDKYDTGAAFLKVIKDKNAPFKQICFNNYVEHYGAGSYREVAEKANFYKHVTVDDWLNKYKSYYE